MQKPEWWERLVAAILDGLVLFIPALAINLIFGLMAGQSVALAVVLGLISILIVVAGTVAYKVLLEAGPKQATLGKMVFGLQVVSADGKRMATRQAILRTWPWWLAVLNFLAPVPVLGILIGLLLLGAWIAIFVMAAMDPNGQGIHDKTAGCLVVKASKGLIAGQ